ncbi:MAG TPA: OmpA family protein [Bacteroidia bacterium]|nr:OmpA family protein [Bacteroidia bacterium]
MDELDEPNVAMHYVRCIMTADAGLIIEIRGFSGFYEKNKIKLSEDRANYIRERFIKEGINPERLKAKGYGDEKPKITKKQIEKAPNKEDKALLDLLNGRCYFHILSDDYGK